MSSNTTYKQPTKKDVEKAFGKKNLTPKTVTMRKCDDVKKIISRLQKAYTNTKKTSQHFN